MAKNTDCNKASKQKSESNIVSRMIAINENGGEF